MRWSTFTVGRGELDKRLRHFCNGQVEGLIVHLLLHHENRTYWYHSVSMRAVLLVLVSYK